MQTRKSETAVMLSHIISSMSDKPLAERKSRKWTPEEDDRLRSAFLEVEGRRWGLIAKIVGSRTPIQCLHRWSLHLRPGITRGAWSTEEDAKVVEWVNSHGPVKWVKCAEQLEGVRSGKQCRERWINSLNPGIKLDKWTQEEDDTLYREYKRNGPKWTLISQMIPGRTENSVKNHHYSAMRKGKLPLDALPRTPLEPRLDDTALSLIEALGKIFKFRTLAADARRTFRAINEALDEENKE